MEGTKKEKFRYYNSLVCLAKALEGNYTIVDLRNEAYISGKIDFVDGYMNIEMSDVTFYNPRGNEYTFETFFVIGRNVRYIHIPDNFNAIQLMENELYLKHQRKRVPDAKRTFKRKRAENYHQETLREISSSKT